jgi:F-type H+-transporting ATPase subunit delta
MISLSVARRYARAFLKVGQREGNYETLGNELGGMARLLRENKELRGVLFSPAYPLSVRKAIVQAIGQPLNLSKTTLSFVHLLMEKDRLDHVFVILRSYEDLGDELSGRVRATLVTAGGLFPEAISAIKERLEAKTGKEVVLSVEQDPSLIGGALTRIGNIVYDGTLKMQLVKIKENLYKE